MAHVDESFKEGTNLMTLSYICNIKMNIEVIV